MNDKLWGEIEKLRREIERLKTPDGTNKWQDYVVAWTGATTNPSIGNGTLNGRYCNLIGKTTICSVFLNTGTTTTYGSGIWEFSLPIKSANNDVGYMGQWRAYKSGNNYCGTLSLSADSTTVKYFIEDRYESGINSAVPFTWTSACYLWFTITYEGI